MANQEALEARYHQLRQKVLQSEELKALPEEERGLAATFAGAFITGLEGEGGTVARDLLLKESLQGTLGGITSWTRILEEKPELNSTILRIINVSEAAMKKGPIKPDQFDSVMIGVGLAELE